MSSVRLRRLQADFEKLSAYASRHPRVRLVQAEGTPPERYQVEFQLRSIRQDEEQLVVVGRHLAEITLPRGYPRMPPQCRMLTPIFHPNIAPHAICIGDHWNAGEPLWSLVMRIGEMIAYQSYNIKSPLNGEAARWVEENEGRLPVDPVPLYVDQPAPASQARPAPTSKAKAAPASKAKAAPAPKAKAASASKARSASAPQAKPAPTSQVKAAPTSKARSAPTSQVRPAPPPAPSRVLPASQSAAASGPVSGKKNPLKVKPIPKDAAAVQAAVRFACPSCSQIFKVSAEMAGKKVRCKNCRAVIVVPGK